MEKVLKLDNTDDMASVRGRISAAFPPRPLSDEAGIDRPQKSRLLIIIPLKNKTFQSLVTMKLLARQAKAKALDLAIVSGHPSVRDFAKEAGVKAFGSVLLAKQAGWVPHPEPAPVPEVVTPPPPPAKPRVKAKKYKVVEGSGRVGVLQQVGALVGLVLLAFVLVFSAIALLSEATVTITPVAQPVEADLIVKADPDVSAVDFSSLVFPARIQQVELAMSGSIDTIETQLAPVGKASGTIVLINRTEEPQIIPISTTISTSAGEPVEFMTVQTTTIPAGVGATTSTLTVAVEPGPGGNVRAGQINLIDPRYSIFARVTNEREFGGGTMEATKQVVEADKVRLQEHLQEIIRQEGLAQLEASLGEQEFVSLDSLQVIVLDVSYEEFSGDFSDTFSGEMQAVVRGTVVGGYNANRLALAALQAQVPAGFELDAEGLHFGAGEVLAVEGQVVTFRIHADGIVVPAIDQNEIAEAIAWLPVGEAQALLDQSYDLATVPGIELRPDWTIDWVGRLPLMPLRIKVVINDAVDLMAEGG